MRLLTKWRWTCGTRGWMVGRINWYLMQPHVRHCDSKGKHLESPYWYTLIRITSLSCMKTRNMSIAAKRDYQQWTQSHSVCSGSLLQYSAKVPETRNLQHVLDPNPFNKWAAANANQWEVSSTAIKKNEKSEQAPHTIHCYRDSKVQSKTLPNMLL